MQQIVATLGLHRTVFTRPYRPQGHGKIEAFNRHVRRAFLAELKASRIRTLDELNEAFLAWIDVEYNDRVHGETGESPLARWRTGIAHVRYADEEQLRQAFLWRDQRMPDKSGVFTLLGTPYQVSAALARRRIELRYDPEALGELEVWCDGQFRERSRPLRVQADRRPWTRHVEPSGERPAAPSDPPRGADWLGHLVRRRDAEHFHEPTPRQLRDEALARRVAADEAVVQLLARRLDPAAFDEPAVREYLARYGPFDLSRAAAVLDRLREAGTGRDLHVRVYLDAIRDESITGGHP